MLSTDPIILVGTLNVGEIKNGYKLEVQDNALVFSTGAKVDGSELILNEN